VGEQASARGVQGAQQGGGDRFGREVEQLVGALYVRTCCGGQMLTDGDPGADDRQ
jgi:hypothetical protein